MQTALIMQTRLIMSGHDPYGLHDQRRLHDQREKGWRRRALPADESGGWSDGWSDGWPGGWSGGWSGGAGGHPGGQPEPADVGLRRVGGAGPRQGEGRQHVHGDPLDGALRG